MWGWFIISCEIWAPHLILLHMKHRTYHLAMSSCIILRIASSCFDLCYLLSMYVLFASSRVDTDTEQFEKEFLYITPENRVRVFSSDLTGEPTSFTYFTVSLSLLSCYPYVAFCCVTCPIHLLTIWAVSPYLTHYPFVWCLESLASRSTSLGYCCYLDMLSGYVGLLGSCFSCYIYWWR